MKSFKFLALILGFLFLGRLASAQTTVNVFSVGDYLANPYATSVTVLTSQAASIVDPDVSGPQTVSWFDYTHFPAGPSSQDSSLETITLTDINDTPVTINSISYTILTVTRPNPQQHIIRNQNAIQFSLAVSTFTPTSTFTITQTPSVTSTPTNTPTVTLSPTVTNTPTITNTPTNTFTITNSPTPTNTNTFTITSTPTNTFTITNTPTPTKTPTNTNSPTSTNTFTPTVTFTITPTPTSTPNPTDSFLTYQDSTLPNVVFLSHLAYVDQLGGGIVSTVGNLTLSSQGSVTITSPYGPVVFPTNNINMASQGKVYNLIDPTNPQDSATKNYVDTFFYSGTATMTNGYVKVSGLTNVLTTSLGFASVKSGLIKGHVTVVPGAGFLLIVTDNNADNGVFSYLVKP